MNTLTVLSNSPDAVSLAEKEINRGHLIAFPTDTVYGLAADVHNAAAIEKLFIAKGRDFNKSIAVLISDLDQLSLLTPSFSKMAHRLANYFWPGALTLIVEKITSLPLNLSSTPTLGIRMPDHEFTRKLLRKTGPLATTSANISGRRNTLAATDVLDQLNGKIDLLIDGGKCSGGVPSTVVDCTKEDPTILRHGEISIGDIEKALRK